MLLETKRLILRNFRSEDWERVHIYASIPEFSQYEIWGPNSIDDTRAFVDRMVAQVSRDPRYQFDFAVCLKENNLLIGSCTIHRAAEESKLAHLGWAVSPDFQGQGYATEAARALIHFGFQKLKLALIYATCDVRNGPSKRVMEKLSMRRVGLIQGTKEVKGRVRDTIRYEIVP